jgi:DNA-binding MarR family transcriptional regulator
VNASPSAARLKPYALDEQVGFILRQVVQRHSAIFANGIEIDLTTTQWAALAKLHEAGPLSQNLLGRLTVMDAATIKGVVDRLIQRGLTETRADPDDGRRRLVSLTEAGRALVEALAPKALRITEETLAPLDPEERKLFTALLLKLR